MDNVSGFLEKFKKIFQSASARKEVFIKGVEEATKIKLEEKDFDIKDFTVVLKTGPGVKNEIFMRKNKILEVMKKQLENKAPTSIR